VGIARGSTREKRTVTRDNNNNNNNNNNKSTNDNMGSSSKYAINGNYRTVVTTYTLQT
jgi:hypothetical protein